MKKIERYIRSSRKYFSFAKDDDIEILRDYLNVSDLNILTINSPSARNEVVKNSEGTEYFVIWDTAYWLSYEKFAQVLLAILSREIQENDFEKELCYLDAVILEHLSSKYRFLSPNFALIMAKESISKGFNDIDFVRSSTDSLKQVVKLSKINLLSHEATHIEFERQKDLEEHIVGIIKVYLSYLVENPEVFEPYMGYPELQDILASLPEFLEDENSHLLMELADDIYSFIEGLMFVSQSINEKNSFLCIFTVLQLYDGLIRLSILLMV